MQRYGQQQEGCSTTAEATPLAVQLAEVDAQWRVFQPLLQERQDNEKTAPEEIQKENILTITQLNMPLVQAMNHAVKIT